MSGLPGRTVETTYQLSQQFDLAGKRGLRRDAAGERLAATQADAERRQISCALQSPSSGRHNPQIELRRTTELE
ncbi:MAG TPA: hypothetical protein VF427_13940 [Noviherbaspirillum sp.]